MKVCGYMLNSMLTSEHNKIKILNISMQARKPACLASMLPCSLCESQHVNISNQLKA